MSDNKNYIGESQMKGTPQKKLKIRISDGAITNEKLADMSISLNKLGEDVTAAMQDIEHYGVVVSQELGYNTNISISQKKLTETIDDMYNTMISVTKGTYYAE